MMNEQEALDLHRRWTGLLTFLDFETYSDEKIQNHGRYWASPNQEMLLASVLSIREGYGRILPPVEVFDATASDSWKTALPDILQGSVVVAHNAGFEYTQLKKLGMEHLPVAYIDTQALASLAGFSEGLQRLCQQAEIPTKLAGQELIKLFCTPDEFGTPQAFDPVITVRNASEWDAFKDYAEQDVAILPAALKQLMNQLGCCTISELFMNVWDPRDWEATTRMNLEGWTVDVSLLARFQQQVTAETEKLRKNFHDIYGELNFNSSKQVIEWARQRGVRLSSASKESLAKAHPRILKRVEQLRAMGGSLDAIKKLHEVQDLIRVKQALGGASTKKLGTIAEMVTDDGKLLHQYKHGGAGQTARTTAGGVQMQNLPRYGKYGPLQLQSADFSSLTISEISENLRQLFIAPTPTGSIVVGDFSSIESRMLAYLAGAEDKLDAFRKGLDVYKVLAAKIDGVAYDAVTPDRRQFGKVGELSCGYQAGPAAVKDFAEGMGTLLTEPEAGTLVADWRGANPEVVGLWAMLDLLFKTALKTGFASGTIANGLLEVRFTASHETVSALHGTKSLLMELLTREGNPILLRVFRGCYFQGDTVVYHKARNAAGGALWRDWRINPKTKQRQYHTLYGGKLTGILTQSAARELFFETLRRVDNDLQNLALQGVRAVGQFHDEIALVTTISNETHWARDFLLDQMTRPSQQFPGLPIDAKVDSAYRYTK